MIRPNGTDRVRAYAVDLDSYAEFGLREEDKPAESWARYIFGVCREIQKRGGRIGGFDTAFSGDVPLGAGMSSSAALESTFAFALNDLYALGIDKFELARIGQSTEHNYCGVKCGIMDQFASVFGKKGCLMRLDCRSMEFEYFPFDPVGYKLVLLDTVVKHELVGARPTTAGASHASAWRRCWDRSFCAAPRWSGSMRSAMRSPTKTTAVHAS